jgi:hypothetical protein
LQFKSTWGKEKLGRKKKREKQEGELYKHDLAKTKSTLKSSTHRIKKPFE